MVPFNLSEGVMVLESRIGVCGLSSGKRASFTGLENSSGKGCLAQKLRAPPFPGIPTGQLRLIS